MSQKELNMLQRRWMELIKYYNCVIDYHSEGINVIVDALSQKNKAFIGGLLVNWDRELLKLVNSMCIWVWIRGDAYWQS
jgi:hypothetical protein